MLLIRSSAFIPPTCGKAKKIDMSDRLSNMSGDTELLNDDVSIVPETPLQGDSPSWADAVDAVPDDQSAVSPELFSPSVVPLPHVLADLMSSGVRFDPVPVERWSRVGNTMRLNKELSVYFSCDTVCTTQDILNGFDAAGIDVDFISSVQFRASNPSWVVTFNDYRVKSIALGKEEIIICGCQIFLGDCEKRVLLVNIYEAPAEMPDTVLIGRLSVYGKVFSFRRDRVSDVVFNGIRTAKMRLNKDIPSCIHIAGEFIRVWYPDQPKTCRRCGSRDHLACKCDSFRCLNCETPGHRAASCPSPVMCSVCLKSDHRFVDCPYVVYGGNISSVDARRSSTYADVSVSCPPSADAPVPVKKSDENRKKEEDQKNKEFEKNKVEKNEDEENEEDEMDEDEEDEENEEDEKDEDHLDEGTRSHDRSGARERERDSCGGAGERCSPGGCASGVSAQDWPRERRRERDRSCGGDRKRSKTPGREDRQSLSDDERGKWQTVGRRR